MRELVSKFLSRSTLMITSLVLAVSSLSAAMPLFLSQQANAVPGINVSINNSTELRAAIENQDNGQTWTINAGVYDVTPINSITAGCPSSCQTGWYMPITANNLTINGVGNPTIYGDGFTANGSWATQNLLTIFGDNVTVNGLTLMPKVEPNKTIEVVGSDSTIKNIVIKPNTLTNISNYDGIADLQDRQDLKQWGGSIYFSHSGNHILNNVEINNGGISYRYAPTGTHVAMNDVKIVDTTNVDWINGYRYSSGFNNSGNSVTGVPNVIYHVNNTLNNMDSVLLKVQNGDTIALESDITTTKQITLNKSLTLSGNNHTIFGNFDKTDNSNNSVLSVQANGVRINELTVDGQNHQLHGINIYNAQDLQTWRVTLKNNGFSGLNVNRSWVQGVDLHTENNGWHGVDVDGTGAFFQSAGINQHNETLYHTDNGKTRLVPALYVDDITLGQVNDTNSQYVSVDNYWKQGDRAYFLKSAAPAAPTNAQWLNSSTLAPLGAYTNQNPTTPAWTAPTTGTVDHYEYSFRSPTAGWSAWSAKTAATNLGPNSFYGAGNTGTEGVWQFRVRTVNSLGLVSLEADSPSITYDRTAPTVPSATLTANSINVPNGGATNSPTFTFNLGSSSDTTRYQLKYWNDIVGSPFKISSPWNPTNLSSYSSSLGVYNDNFSQGDGTHYFSFSACDAADNCSAYSTTPFVVTFDGTEPAVSISGVTVSNGSNKTATISGIATDTNFNYYYCYVTSASGEVGVRDSLCQTAWAAGTPFQTAFAPTTTGQPGGVLGSVDMSGLPTGTYTAHLVAKDKVGNQADTSLSFNVDNTAPILTVGNYIGTSLTPTLTGTTDGATDTVKVDGGTATVSSILNGGGTYDWTYTLPTQAIGSHTITVTSTDNHGNATSENANVTVQQTPATETTPAATTTTITPTGTTTNTTGAAVLGETTTNNAAGTTGNSGVEGATDSKTKTAAASTDNNGSSDLFGLAWYWWLLILAGVAAVVAWIIAAIRRRKEENA